MKYALLPLTIILFLIEWTIGIVVALISILFSEVICLVALKSDGNLRQPFRAIFQPADNPAIGDDMWKQEHPTYSNFGLASSYLRRNAAYGYQYLCRVSVNPGIGWKSITTGNINITDGVNGIAGWYFAINQYGFFEFVWIYDRGNGKCWRGEYGWEIVNCSQSLAGQLNLVLFVRQFNFTPRT